MKVDNTAKLLVKLKGKFPLAFRNPPLPLAVGIYKEIVAKLHPQMLSDCRNSSISFSFTNEGRKLSAALASWTRDPSYLKACKTGAARVDLDGVAVGTVSEAEAKWAAAELRKVNLKETSVVETK
jgi:sRNA-binding protein